MIYLEAFLFFISPVFYFWWKVPIAYFSYKSGAEADRYKCTGHR